MNQARSALATLCSLAAYWCSLCPAQAPAEAPAQPSVSVPQAPAPVRPEAPDREPRAFTAREIVRLALMDLRAAEHPSVAEYRGILALLSIAHDLDPKNTDIIRRQIEASHNIGDKDAVVEFTRALLLIDPTDTVAMLRLISATISRDHQTAETRLAAYDRFIADSRLDPSIRSRLALDAALLVRERDDAEGFRDRLVKSLQLDSTHKEAATLAATFFAQRVENDPAGRLDLLINLLKADPVDPNVHMSIARELVNAGAYAAAVRFHTNSFAISSIITEVGELPVVENRVLNWYASGPASVVKQLNDTVAAERDAAARNLRRLIDDKKPIDQATKPEDVHLPAQIMILYVLACDAAGDKTALEGGMRELTLQIEQLIEKLRTPRTRGEVTDEQALRMSLEAMIQLNSLRLWLDVDAIKFNQVPEIQRSIEANYPNAGVVLNALWALRAGRPQETLDLCRDRLDQRIARVATALAHEQLGNREEALAIYRAQVKDEPLQPASAWCRQRALSLGDVEDTTRAKALEQLVADPRVPKWIDSMAADPYRFIRVSASVPSDEIDACEYHPLRLSITNQSSIPLALGPDRALSSRFMLVAKLEQLAGHGLAAPEVLDIDRRLRLLPRETIQVEVWPTPGQCGWLIDCIANRSVRNRWRLIQGFVPDFKSGFRPGPLSVISETEAFLIRPLASSSLSSTELAAAIVAAPLDSLRRLACVTRATVFQPLILPDPMAPAKGDKPVVRPPAIDLTPVANAFAARYANLSPGVRAMLATVIPHRHVCPEMAAFEAVVRADQDPVVRCITLVTRVVDPADEVLASALTADDPRIRQVAQAVVDRMAGDARVYARIKAQDVKPPDKPEEGAAGAVR